MSTDIGKVFEKQLQEAFRQLKARHLMGWHRFTDSSSAGGAFVGDQPSDYLIGLPPGSRQDQRLFHLEAKASESHSRLQKSMIRPAQRGAINFYSHLLQMPYFILFWDVAGSRLELWSGVEALNPSRSKAYECTWGKISTGRKLNTDLVAYHLAEFFGMPTTAEILQDYEELP